MNTAYSDMFVSFMVIRAHSYIKGLPRELYNLDNTVSGIQ